MSTLFNQNLKTLCQLRARPDPVSMQNGGGGDAGKWSDKTIKMLVKKVKKGDLEKVLVTKNPSSQCVPVAKMLDLGSNSISCSTTKPHSLHHSSLMFCKTWRWPDLVSTHELKSIDRCNYSLSNKALDEACANPYHYTRVEKTPLPPVLIPSGPYACSPTTPSEMPFLPSYDSTQMHTPQTPDCSTEYTAFPDSNLPSRDPMLNAQAYATPPPAYTSEESASDRSSPPSSFANCLSNPASPYFGSHSSTTTIPSPESATVYPHQPNPLPFEPSFGIYPPNTIRFEEQKHWCTIHYYEMESRVGEPFYAARPTLFIDGFTDPSSDERFCLGLLGNIHRDQDIEIARRHINKGVKLTYIAGEVFAECLSDSAIFVQSPNCNLSSGWHPATVCKLPSTCTLNIFNYQDFAQLLSNSVSKGYEAVFQLTRMCTIRISFVKGWGAEYRRQTVTSTPCWIEIHLNGALQWLDRVLQGMGTPLNTCSSRS